MAFFFAFFFYSICCFKERHIFISAVYVSFVPSFITALFFLEYCSFKSVFQEDAGGKWSGGKGVGACQPILVTVGKCLRLAVNRLVVKFPHGEENNYKIK